MIFLNQRIFEKKIRYTGRLADATGLSPSTPIYFKGFKIGTVKDFHLTVDNYIAADLEIFKEYKDRLVTNSALWKGLNPVTNASSLELLQGIGSVDLLPEGAIIPAIDVPEGRQLLNEQKVKQSGDPLSTLLANLQTFTENLTADSIQNRGPIFRAVNNFAVASQDLKEIASKLNYITDALLEDKNPSKGTLFRILNNVADLTSDLKTTNSMIKNTILHTDSLLIAYKSPDSLGIRMIDPGGEKIINPIRQSLAGFNRLLPELEKFTMYMNNKTSDITVLLDDVRVTLQEAQSTFESLNKLLGNEKVANKKAGGITPLRPLPKD